MLDFKKVERNLPKWTEALAVKNIFDFTNCDAVFDVGANKGQYATRLREDVGFEGFIFSFEPTPEIYSELENLTSDDPKWISLPYALSSECDQMEFTIYKGSQFNSFHKPKNDLGSILSSKKVVNTVTVDAVTIDSIFKELAKKFNFQSPFLKMDTQGHDRSVLEGSKENIKQFIGLQSELAFLGLYDSEDAYHSTIDFCESLGFSLTSIFPNNRGHFPFLYEMDCTMINKKFLESKT